MLILEVQEDHLRVIVVVPLALDVGVPSTVVGALQNDALDVALLTVSDAVLVDVLLIANAHVIGTSLHRVIARVVEIDHEIGSAALEVVLKTLPPQKTNIVPTQKKNQFLRNQRPMQLTLFRGTRRCFKCRQRLLLRSLLPLPKLLPLRCKRKILEMDDQDLVVNIAVIVQLVVTKMKLQG